MLSCIVLLNKMGHSLKEIREIVKDLKNPDGRPDYFDELLQRIREIRASEKRFYQKLRDLYIDFL